MSWLRCSVLLLVFLERVNSNITGETTRWLYVPSHHHFRKSIMTKVWVPWVYRHLQLREIFIWRHEKVASIYLNNVARSENSGRYLGDSWGNPNQCVNTQGLDVLKTCLFLSLFSLLWLKYLTDITWRRRNLLGSQIPRETSMMERHCGKRLQHSLFALWKMQNQN